MDRCQTRTDGLCADRQRSRIGLYTRRIVRLRSPRRKSDRVRVFPFRQDVVARYLHVRTRLVPNTTIPRVRSGRNGRPDAAFSYRNAPGPDVRRSYAIRNTTNTKAGENDPGGIGLSSRNGCPFHPFGNGRALRARIANAAVRGGTGMTVVRFKYPWGGIFNLHYPHRPVADPEGGDNPPVGHIKMF